MFFRLRLALLASSMVTFSLIFSKPLIYLDRGSRIGFPMSRFILVGSVESRWHLPGRCTVGESYIGWTSENVPFEGPGCNLSCLLAPYFQCFAWV